jgi:hypothetical protein
MKTRKKIKGGYSTKRVNKNGKKIEKIYITKQEFNANPDLQKYFTKRGILKSGYTLKKEYRPKYNNQHYNITSKLNEKFINKVDIVPIANGSYGMVLKGIPNRSNPHKNLAKTVNKVYFFTKEDKQLKELNPKDPKYIYPDAYIKELGRELKIKDVILSQKIPTSRYGTDFTKKQLLNKMNKLNNKHKYMFNNNTRSNNELLDIITMPYLGTDIHTLCKNNNYIYNNNILVQILKMLNVVYELNKAEYIHGDIRETNILVNTNEKTHDMTLIDFDFFKSYDQFKYDIINTNIHDTQVKYHTPPEYIVLFFYINEMKKNKTLDIDNVLSFNKGEFDMRKMRHIIDNSGITLNTWLDEICSSENVQSSTIDYIHNTIIKLLSSKNTVKYYLDIIIPRIDIYGMGRCILLLLKKYCNVHDNPPMNFICTSLLPNIMNGPYENNTIGLYSHGIPWSIPEAIHKYTKCLKDNKIKIPKEYDRYSSVYSV